MREGRLAPVPALGLALCPAPSSPSPALLLSPSARTAAGRRVKGGMSSGRCLPAAAAVETTRRTGTPLLSSSQSSPLLLLPASLLLLLLQLQVLLLAMLLLLALLRELKLLLPKMLGNPSPPSSFQARSVQWREKVSMLLSGQKWSCLFFLYCCCTYRTAAYV